ADLLAAQLGIGKLWIKDEGARFGLGSFKALGGAYGVAQVVARSHGAAGDITVACASDGNHGRAVAWGAQRSGCLARIYLPRHVTPARAAAIAALGAEVVRVDGEYDDAVRQAEIDARESGMIVVTDTAYTGQEDIPRLVMQGYTVMVEEVLEQAGGERPTHVFVQGGVGGLGAAVLGHLWERLGPPLPRVVLVEPEEADCLAATVRAGTPTPTEGTLVTIMAGLSCRHVSTLAWEVLRHGIHGAMTVPEEGVAPAMRALARGAAGVPMEAGESGVVGLLGLMKAAADPELRSLLGLNREAGVLVFITEGATDPDLYRRIIHGDES
ncbi:MAG: diaminopropionate ammonia-lyase, partial [Gemmatimonadetes bacterium]|nr:diaminopropionate ammonia-lyase [Gemmatimonadota bacterium]